MMDPLSAAVVLRALSLIDTAVVVARQNNVSEEELFNLREQMAGMTDADKAVLLQARSEALQARKDEMRSR